VPRPKHLEIVCVPFGQGYCHLAADPEAFKTKTDPPIRPFTFPAFILGTAFVPLSSSLVALCTTFSNSSSSVAPVIPVI
jgi:hypothetical protein